MFFRTLLMSSACLAAIAPVSAHAQQDHEHASADIVVTASPLGWRANEMATPVLALSGDDLAHRAQATLGDTLSGLPGIHFDNFGGGASRPVIRGQASPRVQTLSDGGSVQDASAISPDHAVVAEPLLLRGIEVLRGPAAMLYGGGAIGGAINLLDNKVPAEMPENGISAIAEGRLGTVDDERSLVGGLTVGLGSSLAFHVEGVHRNTDDYRVPAKFGEKHVDGSYNDTSTISAGASWIGADGYLGFAYTRQHSEYGLPGHNHVYDGCHAEGVSLHCDGEEDDHDHDHDHAEEGHEEEGHEEVPWVKLRSNRYELRSEYANPLPGFDKMRLRMSYTDYKHEEIEEDEVATTFANKAHDLRFELTHKPFMGLTGVFGVQYSDSRFTADGDEAYLEKSDTENTALFLMESTQLGPVRLELATRYGWQSIETTQDRRATHQPFSVSGAAVWDLGGDYSLALHLARSQRAPSAQELYSHGVHLATNTYETGTATLGKETSRSVDLTFRKKAGATTFTLGAYHQDFDNYIYADTLDEYEDFRLIRYAAADARFTGIDGEISHDFTDGFSASVFGDYVRAKLKDGLGNIPRIPAARLGGRADGHWGPFSAHAEYYHVFNQNRIAAFETRTDGYDMVNATLSWHVDIGAGKETELFVRGSNLTNALAYNHASFIKDASPLRGRNFLFGLRTGF